MPLLSNDRTPIAQRHSLNLRELLDDSQIKPVFPEFVVQQYRIRVPTAGKADHFNDVITVIPQTDTSPRLELVKIGDVVFGTLSRVLKIKTGGLRLIHKNLRGILQKFVSLAVAH